MDMRDEFREAGGVKASGGNCHNTFAMATDKHQNDSLTLRVDIRLHPEAR